MKKIYQKIWQRALKYQDKRDDKGHAQIALKFAQELLKKEKADENIVIPAIILHDIDWSQLPLKERFLIYKPGVTDEEEHYARSKHQEESCLLAKIILEDVDYDQDLAKQILKIIAQHDTGQKKLFQEDALVKDADKLWRFSKKGFWADVRRHKISPLKRYEHLESSINKEGFLFTPLARKLAEEELAQRRKEF